MIGATLTTRLAQHGITKSAVTAFALTFLAYNLKFLWAPIVDNVRLPLIGRFGQRRSWLWLVGVLVIAAVAFLGVADPERVALPGRDRGHHRRRSGRHLRHHHRRLSHRAARAAPARRRARACRSTAGASAPRRPARWRWSLAARIGWTAAYMACAAFALPAMLVGVVMGEPARHREPAQAARRGRGPGRLFQPAGEFLGARARWSCCCSC